MHTHSAHAATDISGLGLLGHAAALARWDLSSLPQIFQISVCRCQRNEVSFVIHNLPVIQKMSAVSKAFGSMFGLNQVSSWVGDTVRDIILIAILSHKLSHPHMSTYTLISFFVICFVVVVHQAASIFYSEGNRRFHNCLVTRIIHWKTTSSPPSWPWTALT